MKHLHISPDLSLPSDVLAQTQCILAIKGSGKTYAAMKMMEEAVIAGYQAVALDPTGVWWGISADGSGAGLPVLVMGGEHGNVPLEPTSGIVVAEFVVDSGRSVVLDLSLMGKAEMHRFMGAFLDKLYHYKAAHRENIHVFFDEADTAAPQQPGPEQARVLGAAEDVVRRGRSRGLGMTLITQRPAVLNKNLLEMCDTLYVMRVIGSNDQEAIRKRIRVDADDATADTMMKSLATLQNGEAWVWSPAALGIFKRIKFGTKRTFDSGRSPKPGERMVAPKARADVDLEDLTTRIKATVEKAKENDPKLLKAELEKLRASIKAVVDVAHKHGWNGVENSKILPVFLDNAMGSAATRPPKSVEKPVLKDGQLARAEKLAQSLHEAVSQLSSALHKVSHPVTTAARVAPVAVDRPVLHKPRAPRPDGGGDLPKGERAILTVAAQYPDGASLEQMTVLTGYKRSSRNTYLQRLRERGFIDDSDGDVRPTDAGLEALGDFTPLPTGNELRHYWMQQLPEGERRVLQILIEHHPKSVTKESLDEATGYKRSSRNTYLQRLSQRRLVESGERDTVKASGILFE